MNIFSNLANIRFSGRTSFGGNLFVCFFVRSFVLLVGWFCLLCHESNGIKAVPLQAWSGPEGSRKLRFPDLVTTAQDGGRVVSLTHRPPLPTGNTPGTHFC